jgi:hypothetical protein
LGPKTEPAHSALHVVPSNEPEATLAERLRLGPLALAYALQCATDLAAAMRQLHAQGRTHGRVCADSVLLGETSARLASGPGAASQGEDVAQFGSVLHELLHGCEPAADKLLSAATGVANRCVNSECCDLRKVVTELRVLALLARQRAAHPVAVLPAVVPEFKLEPVRSLAPTDEACPKCGSHYVYKSRPRTWVEGLTRKFGVSLHRCHRCYHRYCTVMGIRFGKNAPSG